MSNMFWIITVSLAIYALAATLFVVIAAWIIIIQRQYYSSRVKLYLEILEKGDIEGLEQVLIREVDDE